MRRRSRHVRQVHRHHQDVGDALVAFMLEVVFGHPERVVAQAVHQLRHGLRLIEDGTRCSLEKRRSFTAVPAYPTLSMST